MSDAPTTTSSDAAGELGPPTVAVVGGGLAGLASALRLATCGFKVTLFEAKDTLGGNLSSEEVNGVFHDVYPHMFCEWYANFWDIFENDLGFRRDDHFAARWGIKLLTKAGDYLELENATTIRSIMANLRSGLASWPDLFLLGFSMLDLAATPFDRQSNDELENLDVNGFVYSRGYSTQSVAQLQNYILMVIWSIQSEITAAASYQDFIKHTIAFPRKTPFSYLLKGPLSVKIIEPLRKKLSELGCDIRLGTTVNKIELAGGGRPEVGSSPTDETAKPSAGSTEAFDYAVLATPAQSASELILTGAAGTRIADAAPHLAQLQRLWGESIPVLDLYFNKKLAGLPEEQFALAGSKQSYGRQDSMAPEVADCDMTVLDLSQLWTDDPNMKDRTALAVAASNRYALPSLVPDDLGYLMIRHLHDYLPTFNPGAHWGDKASDICWEKTHFRANDRYLLFVDEVGSWNVRPEAAHPRELPYVFFAGDYCRTDVDMATIEAAVQSGFLAAQGIQTQHKADTNVLIGAPITTAAHEIYSDAHFLAVKLALLPFAYIACALSAHVDPGPKSPTGELPANAYSPKTYSILLPLAFTLDWWKTAYWLTRRLVDGATATGAPGAEGPPVGLGALARDLIVNGLQALSDAPTPEGVFKPGERFGKALTDFTGQVLRTAQAAFPQTADSAHPARRRWRKKA